jgi:hypothetical protein
VVPHSAFSIPSRFTRSPTLLPEPPAGAPSRPRSSPFSWFASPCVTRFLRCVLLRPLHLPPAASPREAVAPPPVLLSSAGVVIKRRSRSQIVRDSVLGPDLAIRCPPPSPVATPRRQKRPTRGHCASYRHHPPLCGSVSPAARSAMAVVGGDCRLTRVAGSLYAPSSCPPRGPLVSTVPCRPFPRSPIAGSSSQPVRRVAWQTSTAREEPVGDSLSAALLRAQTFRSSRTAYWSQPRPPI